MKKTIILIVTCLSLVLLLSAIGGHPQTYDPNSEPHFNPCVITREHILDYEIIVAPDSSALAKEVIKRLKGKDNWMLIGGVSVSKGKYYQAMLKVTE